MTAGNGAQALERLKEVKPQVIVSDWRMSRMSGQQLLRHIKRDDSLRAIPVLVMSVIPLDAGFPVAGFLQKPFRVHSLLDLIAQVVRGSVR
ncbi:MAG: response regulator [Paraburkholderia tropica]|uniref:response regulator n=1 Tax=Paraburkholderia tropica TaxID=92647 RepID=UPI003101791F